MTSPLPAGKPPLSRPPPAIGYICDPHFLHAKDSLFPPAVLHYLVFDTEPFTEEVQRILVQSGPDKVACLVAVGKMFWRESFFVHAEAEMIWGGTIALRRKLGTKLGEGRKNSATIFGSQSRAQTV